MADKKKLTKNLDRKVTYGHCLKVPIPGYNPPIAVSFYHTEMPPPEAQKWLTSAYIQFHADLPGEGPNVPLSAVPIKK